MFDFLSLWVVVKPRETEGFNSTLGGHFLVAGAFFCIITTCVTFSNLFSPFIPQSQQNQPSSNLLLFNLLKTFLFVKFQFALLVIEELLRPRILYPHSSPALIPSRLEEDIISIPTDTFLPSLRGSLNADYGGEGDDRDLSARTKHIQRGLHRPKPLPTAGVAVVDSAVSSRFSPSPTQGSPYLPPPSAASRQSRPPSDARRTSNKVAGGGGGGGGSPPVSYVSASPFAVSPSLSHSQAAAPALSSHQRTPRNSAPCYGTFRPPTTT